MLIPRRILVTGSRDWLDRNAVFMALSVQVVGVANPVIVHGGATGADAIAAEYAARHPRCTPEEHLAEWEKPCGTGCYHRPRFKNGKPYCPLQGHFRNQKMVDLGADVCLAFPLGESRGTRDCMKRAKRAGIPVFNFGDKE
jgi:hypothetical protein